MRIWVLCIGTSLVALSFTPTFRTESYGLSLIHI